ncbi:putative uncharacterized protein [Desulfovibrio ferrophilus]|uniref:Uncharacterized protein n=1 Tax=Desulfovibrio ferrophilus TaxID=241368 RepID=A0A2Z6B1U8_9BACT|nr:putative uncharacterized protein [Desulfovibrio ferrophilus]
MVYGYTPSFDTSYKFTLEEIDMAKHKRHERAKELDRRRKRRKERIKERIREAKAAKA